MTDSETPTITCCHCAAPVRPAVEGRPYAWCVACQQVVMGVGAGDRAPVGAAS